MLSYGCITRAMTFGESHSFSKHTRRRAEHLRLGALCDMTNAIFHTDFFDSLIRSFMLRIFFFAKRKREKSVYDAKTYKNPIVIWILLEYNKLYVYE